MILHYCLGCGFIRANRLAADDNMLAFDDLPRVAAEDVPATA